MSLKTSDRQLAYFGIGRRKTSVAKVVIVPGDGSFVVNHKPGELYMQFNADYIKATKAHTLQLIERSILAFPLTLNQQQPDKESILLPCIQHSHWS